MIQITQVEAEMQDKFYTVTELANLFGVKRQTIHKWILANRFPGKFMVGEGGARVTLVPASDVDAVKRQEAGKLIEQLDRLGFQAVPA
jgi:excisionase family DNA binding protein